MGSLLMHVSIPSTHVSSFLWDFYIFPFLFFFLCLLCFLFFLSISLLLFVVIPPFFHCSRLWPFILVVVTRFTIFTP